MNKFILLLKSRKFWAALVALIMLFVTAYVPDFPFTEDQVQSFVYVVISYILGTALEDGLSRNIRINK